MWIVKLALSRPYTFIVLSLVLLLISPVVLLRAPVDIFPSINIPVISVIWSYSCLAPDRDGSAYCFDLRAIPHDQFLQPRCRVWFANPASPPLLGR